MQGCWRSLRPSHSRRQLHQHADYCTLAGRGYFRYPDLRFTSIGFRLARSSGNQPSGGGDALGGTTSVSSDSRGTQPRPHQTDKAARWRAGKMGADGASPSKGLGPPPVCQLSGSASKHGIPAAFSYFILYTSYFLLTSVSSDSCGAQPRPIPADKAALARGKSGRRRSIALQGFRRALPRRLRVRRPLRSKW